ncbi:hypothetical protein VPH35_008884 [Triticum aestivum]|uniref:probable glycerol-3-phosphate acyltransferase 2 n=1 Tax=Triticum aestivum TaxID=4565 RepID=UPI001D0106ED|nr:probable glycerol-3-phosphate acyltransferase 2 [Triticum aestivum]
MAMAMSTGDRVVKSNLVTGLLRLSGTMPTMTAAPAVAPPACLLGNGTKTVVLEVDALLLKSSPPSAATLFPPFFLVAVEAGSFARGLLLLALYPFLHLMTHAMCVEAMVMVSFCGLRRDEAARIGRAVLPKYFSKEATRVEALGEAREAATGEVKAAAVSRSFPTVMVEAFLKDYAGFDAVIGREVKGGYGYFAGVMDDGETYAERLRAALKRAEENTTYHYPKPMIFHDGRLAFTPTPAAALAMYVYLPFAVVLSVVRIAIYTLLPRRLIGPTAELAGVRVRVTGAPPATANGESGASGGRLYACNHRTLLDPIAISSALGKPVFAVTYSLSRIPLSELLSPIPLLRLTRGRDEDRCRMSSLLERGDVVVCPEGTTFREPYLLRFSPLFAELADEVSPVAVDERSTMFYGTSTSSGAKCFDSVFFLMNPRPEYSVHFLEPVRTDNPRGSIEVANQVQGVLAGALGFTPTALARKDKYLLLAGNEGVVSTKASKVI